ncbi:hypothetical protein [Cellulomonas sp. Marseille-Q8402]
MSVLPLFITPISLALDVETQEVVLTYRDDWTPDAPEDPMSFRGTVHAEVRLPATILPVD